MEKLVEKLKSLKNWQVIALIIILPLPLAILLLGGSGALSGMLDRFNRKKVDEKSAQLNKQIAAYDLEQAKAQGRLEQLEKDKAKAVASAKDSDATSFHNNRKKD